MDACQPQQSNHLILCTQPQRGRMSTPTIQPFDIMYTRLNALTLFYYVAEPDEYSTTTTSGRFTHDWIELAGRLLLLILILSFELFLTKILSFNFTDVKSQFLS